MLIEPSIEGGHPVEDLDRRWNRHREGDQGEDRVHQRTLARGEHVVAPHQEREDRDRHGTEGDEPVAEDVPVGVDGDDLRDDAHGRQDHDVDGGVRIEPEEVLEQHRVSAHRRVEEADQEDALHDQHEQGDGQDRRRQHLDQGRRVERPEKQRHSEPGHAGRPKLVDRDHEVHAGEDRAEAEDEDAGDHRDHAAGRRGRRIGRVEGPSGVEATDSQRDHGTDRAHDPEVVTAEVEPRERHVLRSQHDRQDEVAERRWNGRDDDQEHHDRTVQGEELVVEVLSDAQESWPRE